MNGVSNRSTGQFSRLSRFKRSGRRFGRNNVRRAATTVRSIMQNRKAFRKLANKLEYHIGEKKYLVTNSGGYFALSASGTSTSMTAVPQQNPAATDVRRDGDQVTIRSLEFNWQCRIPFDAAAPDPNNKVRCLLVQWYPNSVPVVADILLTSYATTAWTMSPYHHDKRFNFRVLYDKVIQLNISYYFNDVLGTTVGTPNPASDSGVQRVRITKFPKRKIQYDGDGALTGNNQIYAIFVSDSAIISHPEVVYVSKFNFSDN